MGDKINIKYTLYRDKQPPINKVCMVQTASKNGSSKVTIASLRILENRFDRNKKEIYWVNYGTGKVIGKPNLDDKWFMLDQAKVNKPRNERRERTREYIELKKQIRNNVDKD